MLCVHAHSKAISLIPTQCRHASLLWLLLVVSSLLFVVPPWYWSWLAGYAQRRSYISIYRFPRDNSGGVEHGTRFLCGILIIPPIFLFYFFFSFVLFEVPTFSFASSFFFFQRKKKRSSPFVCNHSTAPHPSLVLTAYTLTKCYAIVGPIRYSIVLTSPKERKGKEWRVAKWRRGSSTHRARSIDWEWLKELIPLRSQVEGQGKGEGINKN